MSRTAVYVAGATIAVAAFAAAGSGGGFGLGDDCQIKANIAADGGRIYHVPGGAFYDATVIDPAAGERWFCTEGEARAAGWRRSLR